MKSLARIYQVAIFELTSALHTRRAISVTVLFCLAALVSVYFAISGLVKLEMQLAEVLRLPLSDHAGIVSVTLWKSEAFVRMVREAVGDSLVFNDLIGRHPAELLYAWFAFMYVPMLVLLTCAPRVAEDLRSGAVRFMIVRVSRLEWSLGMYLGDALLLLPGLILGALGAWAIMAFRLNGADLLPLLPAVLGWTGKAWILALSWLGIVSGISHLTDSSAKASAFSVLTMLALAIAARTIPWGVENGFLASAFAHVVEFCPSTFEDGLWRATWVPVASSSLRLIMLGLFYLSLGHLVFARRDAR